MKKTAVLIGLCFAIASHTAWAQTDAGQVIIPALKNAEIKPIRYELLDFDLYRGQYDLSNGKSLELWRTRLGRMYARIGNQASHEIVATSEGTFVALDRSMHMQLELDRHGDLSGTMSYIDQDRQKTAGLTGESAVIQVALR